MWPLNKKGLLKFSWIAIVLVISILFAVYIIPASAQNGEICNDWKDNDGDDLVDCADPDCAGETGPGGVTCCQSDANCTHDVCIDTGNEYGGGSCSAINNYCYNHVCESTTTNGTDSCSGEDSPTVTYYYCADEDGNDDGNDTCVSATTTETDFCSKEGTSCSAEDWYCDGNILKSNSTSGQDSCNEDSIDPYYICTASDGTASDTCSEETPIDCNQYDDDYFDYNLCVSDLGDIYKFYQDWTCFEGVCVDSGNEWQDGLAEDCADECLDTDGGDYFTQGTCTDKDLCSDKEESCPVTEYTDFCSGNMLTEYYCDGTNCASETKNCDDYDDDNCWCEVGGNKYLYEKCDDWECSTGACRDSETDWKKNNATCGGELECKTADFCTEYICFKSNQGRWGKWTWAVQPESEEKICDDGDDNDCDGLIDCEDLDCWGVDADNDGLVDCCESVDNCTQDDCVIESCENNECVYTNRSAGATDECGTCEACNVTGGDCVGITGDNGKNCNNDCDSCVDGICTVRVGNDNTEVTQTCYYCDGINTTSQPYSGNDGVNCVDDCTYCNAGSCENREQCDSTECIPGWYCDSAGGDCRNPNENSQLGEVVCEICAQAQHNFGETWLFEDLTTPNCCNNDAGEYYITLGIGTEACCNSETDCVDSDGYCRDEYPNEQTCDDGIDNDCDGLIDCEDLDCDITPPITEKSYGEPFYSDGTNNYINSSTEINLTAEDKQGENENCASGVNKTYYRYCLCENVINGNCPGEFVEYTEPFIIPEDSCHVIEYYSIDKLGNEENITSQTVYVDNNPPVVEKEMGEPKVECDNNEGCDYYITQDTNITLICEDPKDICGGTPTEGACSAYNETQCGNVTGCSWNSSTSKCEGTPESCGILTDLGIEKCIETEGCYWKHASDNIKICYRYGVDEEPADEFICENNDSVTFTFGEDSAHYLEYYCEDALGNRETIYKEVDIVDTVPPIVEKVVGEPKTHCQDEECEEWEWKITTMTPITLNCIDPEPHPVDHSTLYWRIWWELNDSWSSWNNNTSGETQIYIDKECFHKLEYYCVDALGNKGATDEEKFKVEGTSFNITINKKWNLISVPFAMLDDSIDEVFKDIAEDIVSVWTYDGETGDWYVYTPDGDNNDNLYTMQPGWGYWVLARNDTMLQIGGSLFSPEKAPPEKKVVKGWNLIGYYGTNELLSYNGPVGNGKDAYCALNSLVDTTVGYPKWSSLITYWEPDNPNQWVYLDWSDNMDPGAGYWLEIDVDDIYTFATTCYW